METIMDLLSIIIPARVEPYLQKTIESLLSMVDGEVEIIVVLDGYWPNPSLENDDRVVLVHFSESKGMRHAINAAARIAKGKYLMKCDAHCHFDKGFDTKLIKDCEPNWVVVPKRYGLDVEKWKRTDDLYEFQYIRKSDLKGKNWPEYADRAQDQQIVDLMTSQGSCWFMHKDYFWELGGLDEINYGTMGKEAQEVCLKTWLSGGRFVLNRNTWYAHWSKDKGLYKDVKEEKQKSAAFALSFWNNNDKYKYDLNWLINKFAPVPTWRESLDAVKYIQDRFGKNEKGPCTRIDGIGRKDLYRLFSELGFKIGAEIGVWRGENAQVMFENIPNLKLFLVDQYKDYDLARRKRGEGPFVKAKKMAYDKMMGLNVEFLEMFSEDASKHIPDSSLDFVYIDGNHTYDFAMLDIILWGRKVRKGGIISGHDYYSDPKHKMEVKSAVNDYAKQHKVLFYLTDKSIDPGRSKKTASWFWIKQ